MKPIAIANDLEAHTMVVTTGFDQPIERVWQLWADPRQLERWWGPPTYPATVTEHDLSPGGMVRYVMTGPAGDRHAGAWNVIAVDPPSGFEVEDVFVREDGTINTDLPAMRMRVSLTATPTGGTDLTITSSFPSREAMEQVLAMGVEEGLRGSMGQMEAVLAS